MGDFVTLHYKDDGLAFLLRKSTISVVMPNLVTGQVEIGTTVGKFGVRESIADLEMLLADDEDFEVSATTETGQITFWKKDVLYYQDVQESDENTEGIRSHVQLRDGTPIYLIESNDELHEFFGITAWLNFPPAPAQP